MGRVCMGRLGNGPSMQWAEFAVGQDVQLPIRWFGSVTFFTPTSCLILFLPVHI